MSFRSTDSGAGGSCSGSVGPLAQAQVEAGWLDVGLGDLEAPGVDVPRPDRALEELAGKHPLGGGLEVSTAAAPRLQRAGWRHKQSKARGGVARKTPGGDGVGHRLWMTWGRLRTHGVPQEGTGRPQGPPKHQMGSESCPESAMGIGPAHASPPPTATSPFVVESLNEGRLDEPDAVEGECDPVPSADTHVPQAIPSLGVFRLPDRPILLVDIDGCSRPLDLCSRRNRIVLDTPPGTHARVQALFRVQIIAEGKRDNGEGILIVGTHADPLRALVS